MPQHPFSVWVVYTKNSFVMRLHLQKREEKSFFVLFPITSGKKKMQKTQQQKPPHHPCFNFLGKHCLKTKKKISLFYLNLSEVLACTSMGSVLQVTLPRRCFPVCRNKTKMVIQCCMIKNGYRNERRSVRFDL